MNWTGEYYYFYSNKSIKKIFEFLKTEASKIDFLYDYKVWKNEESLFFYKIKEMYDYHMEHGYNTHIRDEGCFCVQAKITHLNGVASLLEFDGVRNFDPQDIHLIIDEISHYVLIVPNPINECNFSSKINEIFTNAIKRNKSFNS
jgi:hypothetical protein